MEYEINTTVIKDYYSFLGTMDKKSQYYYSTRPRQLMIDFLIEFKYNNRYQLGNYEINIDSIKKSKNPNCFIKIDNKKYYVYVPFNVTKQKITKSPIILTNMVDTVLYNSIQELCYNINNIKQITWKNVTFTYLVKKDGEKYTIYNKQFKLNNIAFKYIPAIYFLAIKDEHFVDKKRFGIDNTIPFCSLLKSFKVLTCNSHYYELHKSMDCIKHIYKYNPLLTHDSFHNYNIIIHEDMILCYKRHNKHTHIKYQHKKNKYADIFYVDTQRFDKSNTDKKTDLIDFIVNECMSYK